MVLPPRGHFFFYNFEEKEYQLLGRAPGLFVKGEGIPAFVAGAGLIFERERRALFGRAKAGFKGEAAPVLKEKRRAFISP